MTPNDILTKRFDKGVAGYKVEDVNVFMMETADYVERLLREKEETEQKLLVLADKLEEYREDEESLRAALIGAQKLGDNVVKESKQEAQNILAEAKKQADKIVLEAEHRIEKETEALRQIRSQVSHFRTQVLDLYKQHIEMIQGIPHQEEASQPIAEEPAASIVIDEEDDLVQYIEIEEEDLAGEELMEFEEMDLPDIEEGFPKRRLSKFGSLDKHFGENAPLTRDE